MNVLGISATPRKGGNSEILLDAALAPFIEENWNVNKVLLSKMRIEMCTGCETCNDGHICFIDDVMNKIYEAYDMCNAIIISAPSYWRNVPAQLKAVSDRTFAVKDKKPLKGKLGGVIAVGRGSSGGQSIVLNIIHNFYLSCVALCSG